MRHMRRLYFRSAIGVLFLGLAVNHPVLAVPTPRTAGVPPAVVGLAGAGRIPALRAAARLILLSARRTPTIVLPPTPTPVENFAARQLQTYLRRITGKKPHLERTAAPKGAPLIILGPHPYNQDLGWQKLDPDSFVIAVGPHRLRIAGGIGPTVKNAKGQVFVQERGTLYGVYQFLENLGVRWYRPERWGEYVPKLKRIVLPLGRKTYRPAYKYRWGIDDYVDWQDETARQRARTHLWATRNRLNTDLWTPLKYGGYYYVDFDQCYQYLLPPKEYFAKHPDYYAWINGRRDPQGQLDLANPAVQRLVAAKVIAQARANPEQRIISVSPNDGGLWGQGPRERAMDDPKLQAVFGGVSMSNRVCAFNNIVARLVAHAVPRAKIGCLAYWDYTEVPTLVKALAPNLVVMLSPYAAGYSDYSRNLDDPDSVQNANFLRSLRGYSRLSKELMTYEYWSGYCWYGPLPIIHTMVNRLRAYRRYHVVGVYNESHPSWGPQGLDLYMYCQLLWNPNMNVHKELDLYYRNYFGPAAAPMKRYYQTMEKAAQTGPYFGSGGYDAWNLFTDALLRKLGRDMAQARALVRNRKLYAQRLEGVWAGYQVALRTRRFLDLRLEGKFLQAAQELKGLEHFIQSFKGGWVFDNGPVAWPSISGTMRTWGRKLRTQERVLFGVFKHPRIVESCDKGWLFHIDPRNLGLQQGWMTPTFHAVHWPRVTADLPWQDQGYPAYHGVAWYRRSIQPPAHHGTQQIILYFGAVDGNATVFLNGKPIGVHRLLANGFGWDKPFYFNITRRLIRGQPNVIAVRVKKLVYLSGIDGGVLLLRVQAVRRPNPAGARR